MKAVVSQMPADFAPGRYTVVLEPSAFQAAVKALLEGADAQNVLEDKDSVDDRPDRQADVLTDFTLRSDLARAARWRIPRSIRTDGTPAEAFESSRTASPKRISVSTYMGKKYHVPVTG